MDPKKILLLINPKSRSGSTGSSELKRALVEAGHSIIQDPDEDFRRTIFKYKNDVDLVLIGGGDGTINYVLPPLVETHLPIIIFPMGTANLLARSFNIKADVEDLLNVIETGVVTSIDLGSVNGIYFINVCGLGISTEVNQKVSPRLKKLTGPLSFWIQGLKLLRNFEPFRIKIKVDDSKVFTRKTWQVTICNGRKYAAWMTIEPDASYEDELLRCLSTEVTKWWQGIRLLPSYIKGTYKDDYDISFLAGKRLVIESKKKLSIDVDGDVQTSTPAVFEVHSKALKIILPSTLDASAPLDLRVDRIP